MDVQFFTPPSLTDLYVISDTHGFHKNIVRGVSKWPDKSGCRDFNDEIEMTEALAKAINLKVSADSWLIHLGDWTFGGIDKIIRFREMINCKNICLILGNHDTNIQQKKELHPLFSWIGHYNEFYIGKKLICLFHRPVLSWTEMKRGSFMLSGHIHSINDTHAGRQLDCGVDMKGLPHTPPYHISEIFDILDKKPIK